MRAPLRPRPRAVDGHRGPRHLRLAPVRGTPERPAVSAEPLGRRPAGGVAPPPARARGDRAKESHPPPHTGGRRLIEPEEVSEPVGMVLGTEDSTPLTFWVGVAPDAYL